jgi:hypothetical protein
MTVDVDPVALRCGPGAWVWRFAFMPAADAGRVDLHIEADSRRFGLEGSLGERQMLPRHTNNAAGFRATGNPRSSFGEMTCPRVAGQGQAVSRVFENLSR